jgi:hypothetical protein
MVRVAHGLRNHAPSSIAFVDDPKDADVEVLHVIGPEALTYETPARALVPIQYCVGSAIGGDVSGWFPLWTRTKFVASYYDLRHKMPPGVRFLHMPLGVDSSLFNMNGSNTRRDIGVMTSGYVTGPGAEAIEEVARAAHANGMRTLHLGPVPVGLTAPLNEQTWGNVNGISDRELVRFYRRCQWVSGLRYIEGFELPVLEGLACGARPIVFDRADMHQWFDGHAVFVPECFGKELIDILTGVMAQPPDPVSWEEYAEVLSYFNWEIIADRFWAEVLA